MPCAGTVADSETAVGVAVAVADAAVPDVTAMTPVAAVAGVLLALAPVVATEVGAATAADAVAVVAGVVAGIA